MRAQAETLLAERTWFFTGTFRAQYHDHEDTKEHVTLFLKRLRERCRGRHSSLRYIVLPERHKSGAIHYHSLLHCNSTIGERTVRNCWTAGFSDAQISDIGSAGYVTKYATKDLTTGDGGPKRPRIRASRNPTYGGWVICRDREQVQQMLRDKPDEEMIEVWRKNLKMILRELMTTPDVSRRKALVEALNYNRVV